MNMIDYINEQPTLFKKVLEGRKENTELFCKLFSKINPDRIYLVASGTSKNAARAASSFMESVLGIEVTAVEPSRAAHYFGKSPLLIFISQGGNSTNTIAAIRKAGGMNCIAMTGNPDGTVNTMCENYVEIPCGEETAGPKTKGYTITILELYLMALEAASCSGRITKEDYAEYISALTLIGNNLEENIKRTMAWYEANKETIKGVSKIYMVGKQQGMNVAEEGALKVMETFLVPSIGFEFEEYMHGPTCSLASDVSGFYLFPVEDDEDYDRMCRMADYHRGIAPSVYTVGLPSSTDKRDLVLVPSGKWYASPFEQILPMQVISALIPEINGIEGEGAVRFKKLDSVLSIKAKKE